MELNKAQQRREYKENLEKQRQHLEILMEQVFANSMRAITISNKVYANCLLMDDPLKACAMAIKSGAHTQAKAAMQGRDYVLPDDIKALAVPTLAHRVILGPGARLRDLSARQVVEEIMNNLPVPGGDPTGTSRPAATRAADGKERTN